MPKSSLRKREFILGFGPESIESIMVGKAWQQEQEAARSHFIHKQEGERERNRKLSKALNPAMVYVFQQDSTF